MTRSRIEKYGQALAIWASLAMAKSRPEKYGLAHLANELQKVWKIITK